MKFGIVVFPGSNCDHDCYHVVKHVLGQEAEFIWHREERLEGYDCLILPGGFSYGDYLRAGAIARFSPIMAEVVRYARDGGLVLGICNGFQVLLEAGLLPGAMRYNRRLKFICQYVYIRVETCRTPFTAKLCPGQVLSIPIAHMQGNYYIDAAGLKTLQAQEQIVFRYCGPEGQLAEDYNPNGSVEHIAGICNPQGNVLGMMPHPERCAEEVLGSEDGRLIFTSALAWLEEQKQVREVCRRP